MNENQKALGKIFIPRSEGHLLKRAQTSMRLFFSFLNFHYLTGAWKYRITPDLPIYT